MIHYFPEDFHFEEPSEFTDPFRYAPHPAVRKAAGLVMQRIEEHALTDDFAEGKMLGVLVCREPAVSGRACYIAAFSGNIGGRSMIEGFVPPIYDLTDPDGEFKKREAEISALNARIDRMQRSDEYSLLKKSLEDAGHSRDKELDRFRSGMAESKARRSLARASCSDAEVLAGLIRESQFEKAELRRLKLSWEERISELKSRLDEQRNSIDLLKKQRACMSESLQDWIFRQYKVHDALGNESSIADIFAHSDLVPPGGTGECAAPKLLEYAYRHGLKPLAMGEFWYGHPSQTAVRNHGRFYPSCTSKCGPLLGFMLRGITISSRFDIKPHGKSIPITIHEDEDIIVVEKPSGMPSVPGLDGRKSLQEWMSESRIPSTKTGDFVPGVHSVHRLDMDTSGVMIFAKTSEAAVNLRRQFEEHSVRKTYMARVSCIGGSAAGWKGAETVLPPCPQGEGPKLAWEGLFLSPSAQQQSICTPHRHISLPLSPDYDERPRQKVDLKQGKPAYTEYEIISENRDGTADLLLHPHTGRTHQLRVHCAHALGLARPIVGDLLYGGDTADRLHLHALTITFTHPSTGETLTFSSKQLCYGNSLTF